MKFQEVSKRVLAEFCAWRHLILWGHLDVATLLSPETDADEDFLDVFNYVIHFSEDVVKNIHPRFFDVNETYAKKWCKEAGVNPALVESEESFKKMCLQDPMKWTRASINLEDAFFDIRDFIDSKECKYYNLIYCYTYISLSFEREHIEPLSKERINYFWRSCREGWSDLQNIFWSETERLMSASLAIIPLIGKEIVKTDGSQPVPKRWLKVVELDENRITYFAKGLNLGIDILEGLRSFGAMSVM